VDDKTAGAIFEGLGQCNSAAVHQLIYTRYG